MKSAQPLDIREVAAQALVRAYAAAGWGELALAEAQASLSFCDIEFGDLASNLALTQAQNLKQSPRDIAQALVSQLQTEADFIAVEVAGPGFINLRLTARLWCDYVGGLQADFYERKSSSDRSINVEFISANPTGPLVLVNAWGGYYGDILARVFASQGWRVVREYYLNNGGRQIVQLGRAVQQAAGKEFSAEEAEELYRGDYVDKLAADLTQEYGSAERLVEANPQVIGDKVQEIIFQHLIRPTVDRLGIHHDVVTPETSLDTAAIIERLRSVGAVSEHDDAVWLSGEAAGLDKDEVLVRSHDKQETYFLKDIAYQTSKLEAQGFDRAITIVGPDHHGQEQRLIAALKLLGLSGFVPLWTQTVRLTKDGQEFKMSKRRGNYILLDEFLDQVPSDTARFFFAMRDTNSHLDLDLDLIAAQNRHNPLYYVMYAYVRTHAVLRKADTASGHQLQAELLDQAERALWRQVVVIDDKITACVDTYQVHPILHAFIELARDFHDWYETHPVLQAETEELRNHRLATIEAFQTVSEGLFRLIGITPVERM